MTNGCQYVSDGGVGALLIIALQLSVLYHGCEAHRAAEDCRKHLLMIERQLTTLDYLSASAPAAECNPEPPPSPPAATPLQIKQLLTWLRSVNARLPLAKHPSDVAFAHLAEEAIADGLITQAEFARLRDAADELPQTVPQIEAEAPEA